MRYWRAEGCPPLAMFAMFASATTAVDWFPSPTRERYLPRLVCQLDGTLVLLRLRAVNPFRSGRFPFFLLFPRIAWTGLHPKPSDMKTNRET